MVATSLLIVHYNFIDAIACHTPFLSANLSFVLQAFENLLNLGRCFWPIEVILLNFVNIQV